MNVAVLGASPKPRRYAHQALLRLLEHGHDVIPVHPVYKEIEGLAVAPGLDRLTPGTVDTVTVYLNPRHSTPLAGVMKRLCPRRVIFNPGAENQPLAEELAEAGVEVVNACTLVLLAAGRF